MHTVTVKVLRIRTPSDSHNAKLIPKDVSFNQLRIGSLKLRLTEHAQIGDKQSKEFAQFRYRMN